MNKMIPKLQRFTDRIRKGEWMKMVFLGGHMFPVDDGGAPGLVQGRLGALQELWSQSLGNRASSQGGQ